MDSKSLSELFEKKLRVAITTHRSPDGDAIGSSLGMQLMLQKLEHEVEVIVPDAFPTFLSWMKNAGEVLVYEEHPEKVKSAIENADVIFSLDYNRLDRIAQVGVLVEKSTAKKLLIDHHIDPSTDFDFSLSDVSASSTCELVYRFASQLGWEHLVDKDIGEALYTGIMTDTGSFKFSSTSANTHRIVAQLMEAGVVPEKVHSAIFDTNRFERLQMVGFALTKKLTHDDDKGISIISLSLNEKNRFKYQKGDTEGLVNYGLSIERTRMAVFLSEELGFTKFSFRSKGDLDVNQIAREYFNGGGHKNAAGGKLDLNLSDSLNYLYEVINEKLNF